jgi:hypothetical protein
MMRLSAEELHLGVALLQLLALRAIADHPFTARQINLQERLDIFSTATRPTYK